MVNIGKREVKVRGMTERWDRLNLSLNEDILEKVESFNYFISNIGKVGGY